MRTQHELLTGASARYSAETALIVNAYIESVVARTVAVTTRGTYDEDAHQRNAEAFDNLLARLDDAGDYEDAERWRYLEDWASGRDVHLRWSQDHDGKRVENRGDHDVLWINAPIGDCDESGYVEGQTLGEAMDEARNQPHV